MKKDFGGLATIIANLQGMQDEQDKVIKRMSQRLAQIFLREVKKRTPVGEAPEIDDTVTVASYGSQTVRRKAGNGYVTYQRKVKRTRKMLTAAAAKATEYWQGYQGGALQRAWVIRGVRRIGGVWTATIFNPMEYASYVENGHRQKPGRFVPALGKTLKKNWVKGRFMMRLSAEYVEKEGAAYVQREFETYMRRHWSGK